MKERKLLLSCEHASAHVPPYYQQLFASRSGQQALASHRGSDLGALAITRKLGRHFGISYAAGTFTRLLIDLNRSPTNYRRFSEFSAPLGAEDKQKLQAALLHYQAEITAQVKAAPCLHLAVHSFTPELRGQKRDFEIGILYDPSREREWAQRFASELRRLSKASAEPLRVRLNAPYRGTADGLPTLLRRRFGARKYAGIELELNQAWLEKADKRAGQLIALALEVTWGSQVEQVGS